MSWVQIDTSILRNGDLIFREGISFESRAVLEIDSGAYSHIGILYKGEKGWEVIHAVPGETEGGIDTVKIEPLAQFLQPDRCVQATTLRTNTSDEIATRAVRYAKTKVGKPFDNSFDLHDTSAYYCTELIWQAYLRQGIDLSKGRRHRLRLFNTETTCLLPTDLM